MVNANTSQGEAKHTVAMIQVERGHGRLPLRDVTDPAAVAKMVTRREGVGRLDILVNNAAVERDAFRGHQARGMAPRDRDRARRRVSCALSPACPT